MVVPRNCRHDTPLQCNVKREAASGAKVRSASKLGRTETSSSPAAACADEVW